MLGASDVDDATRGEVEEEENGDLAEADGIDGEEIAGDDRGGLSPDELAPGEATLGRGGNAMAAEDGADGGGGDTMADLDELALDPEVAPTRVLLGHPDHELADLVGQRWPAAPGTEKEGRPLVADEVTMPAEDGFWLDGQGCPCRRRQVVAESGEEHPVGQVAVRSPAWVASKNDVLVAERDDLGLVGGEIAEGCAHQSQEHVDLKPEQSVVRREEHRGMAADVYIPAMNAFRQS